MSSGTAVVGAKGLSGLQDAKREVDEFPHDGADDDHLVFPTREQSSAHGLRDRVVAQCGECGEKQRLAQRRRSHLREAWLATDRRPRLAFPRRDTGKGGTSPSLAESG